MTDACEEKMQPGIVSLFDIPINSLSMDQTLDRIHAAIQDRTPLHIGVVNAAKVVNSHRNPELGEDVKSSDIILADGIAIVWASRLLSTPLPERVTGIGIMEGIFRRGMQHGYRIYCLGATEDVSKIVAERLAQDYPGVILAGRRNGYFNDDEEETIATDIANSKADVLLVAITSPKKERFMARWNDLMEVPVVHGVGGSFDVMAGKVERAPEIWQRFGLEWLYRVKQEPRRLWKRYLVTNVLFCWMVFKAVIKQRLIRTLDRKGM